MTWDTFHRRGEVLRNVLAHAETYRDGTLPMQLTGARETFGDEHTLLGALQLRWHTHLAGAIERELAARPHDLEDAVTDAWRKSAGELAGLRTILDVHAVDPASPETAEALAKAQRKDWTLMAAMAGKASPTDPRAAEVGRAIELRARETFVPVPHGAPGRRRAEAPSRGSLLRRVKAALAA
jgi:hypothetical protein